MKKALIFTCYKPDLNFEKNLISYSSFIDFIIVVDNTPGGFKFNLCSKNIIILQDGVNKGLGAALNIGLLKARDCMVDIVYLFDQDSTPSQILLKNLEKHLLSISNQRVCIAPLHIDDQVADKSSPPLDNLSNPTQKVTCLATSGMIFRLNQILDDDFFDQSNLFLDFVDFEWCWRLANKGWSFYRINSLSMLHRLGLSQSHFFGIKYHVPSPYRHYYQFRDTLKLISNPLVPLYSKFKLGLILIPKFFIYPFILPCGFERFRWMMLGINDGLKNIPGIGAARILLG